MKKILLVLGFLTLSAGVAGAQGFTLKSDQIGRHLTIEQVYSGFGCAGKNISPSLKWINAPKNARSFAVTVYDPDAPTGSGWWHWLIFNIPADVSELKADAGDVRKQIAPAGSIQSITDYGEAGFGGACPPPGDKPHRYVFTVYALDVPKLDADKNTMPAQVGFMLNQHAVSKAVLISYYGR